METNEKKITQEVLSTLGVYELRELARTIGVVSPTTKKRGQLCKEILEISEKGLVSQAKQTNKGRPPKSITKISNMVKEFIPEEILNLQKPIDRSSYSNILKLAQNSNTYSSDNNGQICGYVNSINGHFYLNNIKNSNVFSSNVFYLPNETINEYSLREGDKILAIGKMSENYNCGLIDNILEINSIPAINWNKKSRLNLDVSAFSIPCQESYVFGKSIRKGERTLSFYENAEDAIFAILNEIEDISSQQNLTEKLVFVGIELAPEILYYGKTKENLEMFSTSYYNSLEESYNAVVNAINHCNSMLKDGKNIKLFVFDVFGILTRLDQHFASQPNMYLGHNVEGVQLVKKLVGAGKAVSGNLSITSHSIAFNNQKEDEFTKNELSKIAKII